jgi:flagellar protein FlgJ
MTILPPAAHVPDAATLARPGVAKMWQTAKDFEAMALGEMLGPMFNSVDSAHGMFGGGAAEQTWKPMLTQQLAKQMAAGGGLGLAIPVFQQMLRMQETAQNPEAT